jgi:hypothetical protein
VGREVRASENPSRWPTTLFLRLIHRLSEVGAYLALPENICRVAFPLGIRITPVISGPDNRLPCGSFCLRGDVSREGGLSPIFHCLRDSVSPDVLPLEGSLCLPDGISPDILLPPNNHHHQGYISRGKF